MTFGFSSNSTTTIFLTLRWPEMNSSAVSETGVESSAFELFNEWLKGWFDGGAHAIGRNELVAFPKAVLRYQQDKLPQPLGEQVGIALVWVNTSKAKLS
jgi:hypothetical protein